MGYDSRNHVVNCEFRNADRKLLFRAGFLHPKQPFALQGMTREACIRETCFIIRDCIQMEKNADSRISIGQ